MESPDIKIHTPKKKEEGKKEEEKKPEDIGFEDYIIEGAAVGGDVLKKIKRYRGPEEEEVVYGVYDNRNKGLFVRINDFLIDHGKIGLKEKSYFFHMLAVMVDAGIPVIRAVKSLAGRNENKHFRRVLNTIAYNCEQGSTLSNAMSRFENVFDESEVGIVKSGEATGRLHLMLFKLSSQLDKKHDLSMKLWGAAAYPIAVFVVLILVAVGMLVWVFPSLINLLTEGGVTNEQLPFETRLLIGFQSGLVNYWWAILIVIFGLYGLFSIYRSSEYGAVSWDYRKLKIPIIGTLLRKVFVLRFVSLLGLLIDSGLPVIRALKISGSSISNRVYRLKLQEVINNVTVGEKISASLSDSQYLFPGEVVQMLRVGEASANLAKVSEKIAEQYEREVDGALKKISSIFEPVMILVVGLFVALLAMAIMVPIFNLGGVIGT